MHHLIDNNLNCISSLGVCHLSIPGTQPDPSIKWVSEWVSVHWWAMLLIRYSATSAELLMDMFRNAIMKLFALTLQIELFPPDQSHTPSSTSDTGTRLPHLYRPHALRSSIVRVLVHFKWMGLPSYWLASEKRTPSGNKYWIHAAQEGWLALFTESSTCC